MSKELCPFKVGEKVIYKPSERGRGLVTMTDFAALVPGHVYKVVRIDNDAYVVPEGFEHAAGGGLHWTEFRSVD